jgi:SAM-dependent methyltransferase
MNSNSADTAEKDKEIIIGRDKAERYSNQLKKALRGAEGEEDVRQATYNFLVSLTTEVGINVRLRNERVVVSGGRIDSLFDNIIFEFKKPNYFDTPAGIEEAVRGRKKGESREGGLIEYLLSLAIDESSNMEDFLRHLSAKIGIGFDGSSFVFVRYVQSEGSEVPLEEIKARMKHVPAWLPDYFDGAFLQQPQKDLKTGLRFLYLSMRAISPRDPLKPVNVSKRFGEKSQYFRKHLRVLYTLLWESLRIKKEPHVETLYGEWNRVFGRVYGDIGSATRTIREKLTDEYKDVVDFSQFEGLDIQLLIFTIHTYYNIILKFLVSELLQTLLNPFSRRSVTLALTDEKFKQRMIDTMNGEYFKIVGVENFFEASFFEWWLYVWNDELSSMLREVIQLMEELEVTTSIIKPELIGDTVKETYHSLMPESLRHLLGEYFTPDWLADYAVTTSGFKGKLGETFLDPACGSGTFLTLAIKQKILTNQNIDRKVLIDDIIKTVVGFDLNPISVIASKTNYLLTLGDLEDLDFTVKIPVFQCDSILTPAVHAKQKADIKAFEIDTFCGKFTVPAFDTRDQVAELLDIVKLALKNNFTDDEYVNKLSELKKTMNIDAALELFKKVKTLNEQNRNGLWIPILKNAFAPVYSRAQFDYVVGNPPWVSWRSMSKSYRELTLPIWWSYDIFNKTAYDKGTTHDDFAMAFTYVSADHYLKKDGKLCFVISQSFFKSRKGGEGFRKFQITRNGLDVPIKVEKVADMVAIKPFHEVTNRTSVMLIQKGKPTTYPVPYVVWNPKKRVNETDTLTTVLRKISSTEMKATPIGGVSTQSGLRSPWLTLPIVETFDLKNIIGKSDYRGRKGVEPLGAKGVYVLQEPTPVMGGRLRIRNALERGRLREIEELGEHDGLIEDTFVYPLVSGRNLDRYGANSYSYIMLPHMNKKGPHNGVPESELKVRYTATYEWLSYWRDVLIETRERNSKFYDSRLDPFYILDNVGTYTFSPFKVAWREQNKRMIACVLSTKPTEPLAGKLVIPDSKVLFCPMNNEDEAHYLCALLNSKPVTEIIEGYTLELQRGIDILENIRITKYDSHDSLHQTLSRLSHQAHQRYPDEKAIERIQSEIDLIAKTFFQQHKNPTLSTDF